MTTVKNSGSFTVLVPNIAGFTDPARDPIRSGNADVLRNAYTFSTVRRDGEDLVARIAITGGSGEFEPSVGDIELTGGTFPSGDIITLGGHTLIEGVHWTGGAAALATAIDSLPEFSATEAVGVVSIVGPIGPSLPAFRVVNKTNPANWTMDVANSGGFLIDSDPSIAPPEFT